MIRFMFLSKRRRLKTWRLVSIDANYSTSYFLKSGGRTVSVGELFN